MTTIRAMEFLRKKSSLLWGLLCVAVIITACVPPTKEDPFSRLPQETRQTLDGTVFPFQVSVATSATHRLEKDEHLQALLASKIVRLEDFEGRNVEVKGYFQKEQMREIFWVEEIHVKDSETQDEEATETRFETKTFSFLVPQTWEFTTSPTGMMQFVDKNDPARRVFLMFSVDEISSKDKKRDPDVLISNLAGTKKTSKDEFGRERQEIALFSNLFETRKYSFTFTSSVDEFEKKKAFLQLLSSFVEGEENVQKLHEADLKKLAEAQVQKLEAEAKNNPEAQNTNSETVAEEKPEVKSENLLEKLFGSGDSSDEEKKPDEVAVPATPAPVVTATGDFKDMIDAKAVPYESSYYKFSMKVPYGFWFRNFGPSEGFIDEIGFANFSFTQKSEAQFLLQIVDAVSSVKTLTEKTDGNNAIFEFPRDEKSFFRLSGPKEFSDAMRSIQGTIKSF